MGVNHGYKGKGSLLHLLVDAQGKCIGITSTGANGNERKELLKLIDLIKVTVKIPKAMTVVEADKGYDSNQMRQELLNRGFFPLISWRRKRKNAPSMEEVLDLLKLKSIRWVVERTHSWWKRRYRRLLVRWERNDEIWQAMVQASLILSWIKILLR